MPLAGVVRVLVPAVAAVTAMAQAPRTAPLNPAAPPTTPAAPTTATQPQPKPESAALLESTVRDLGSDDVTLRLDAQRRLIDASSLRLRDIEATIKAGGLTAEQRRRLLIAAYVRFCTEPRAGMGVQANTGVGERGLLLQMIVPDFPASEVLRPGDRLMSVDGHPLSDIMDMRPIVVAHDPGDEVPAVVVRAGNTFNLKVRLGRYSDLRQRDSYQITSDLLDEAWALRSASLVEPMDKGPAVIDSGLPASAWQVVGTQDVTMDFNDGGDPNVDARIRMDTRRLQNPEQMDSGAVASGEPRGAGSQVRWASQQGVPPTLRIAPGGADAQVLIGPNVGGPMDARAEFERIRAQRLTAIRQEQGMRRQGIERLRAQLATAGEARKRELIEQIAAIQRRIDDLERLAQRPELVNP